MKMNPAKILIVDDEPMLVNRIKYNEMDVYYSTTVRLETVLFLPDYRDFGDVCVDWHRPVLWAKRSFTTP